MRSLSVIIEFIYTRWETGNKTRQRLASLPVSIALTK
jgi:hypothetical protein